MTIEYGNKQFDACRDCNDNMLREMDRSLVRIIDEELTKLKAFPNSDSWLCRGQIPRDQCRKRRSLKGVQWVNASDIAGGHPIPFEDYNATMSEIRRRLGRGTFMILKLRELLIIRPFLD